MNKEYIYDWDELQNICDDRGLLTPDEAAAYLSLKQNPFTRDIDKASVKDRINQLYGKRESIECIRASYFNTEKLSEWEQKDFDETVSFAIDCCTFRGREFSLDQIKDLPPEMEIWFLKDTGVWSIGRPTWRQIVQEEDLRIYIRIS